MRNQHLIIVPLVYTTCILQPPKPSTMKILSLALGSIDISYAYTFKVLGSFVSLLASTFTYELDEGRFTGLPLYPKDFAPLFFQDFLVRQTVSASTCQVPYSFFTDLDFLPNPNFFKQS
jgi:hypothetical protein